MDQSSKNYERVHNASPDTIPRCLLPLPTGNKCHEITEYLFTDTVNTYKQRH